MTEPLLIADGLSKRFGNIIACDDVSFTLDEGEVLVQRDPAGLTPTLEMRIIEATELTLHRRASEATTAEQAALLELNQLRGRPLTEPVKVQRPALSLPSAPDVDSLLAAALTNNFELPKF